MLLCYFVSILQKSNPKISEEKEAQKMEFYKPKVQDPTTSCENPSLQSGQKSKRINQLKEIKSKIKGNKLIKCNQFKIKEDQLVLSM